MRAYFSVQRNGDPTESVVGRLICTVLCCWWWGGIAGLAWGQDEPAASGLPAVSASQRFIIRGLSRPENVELAAWVEDAADRMQSLLDMPFTVRRGEPLRIVIKRFPGRQEGRVIKAQGWINRRLQQQLVIEHPGRVDQEEVLAGLAWLLLNRFVIMRQHPEARRDAPGMVPDWMAVGLAQNLFSAQRHRNNRIVAKAWREDTAPSFEQLISLSIIEPDDTVARAFAGAAMEWLMKDGLHAGQWADVFRYLAANGQLRTEDFCRWMALDTAGELEQLWDLMLAGRQHVKRAFEPVGPADIRRLQSALIVTPEILSMITLEDHMQSLTPEALISRREMEWMPALGRYMSMQVLALSIGRPDDFGRLVRKYAGFFQALAQNNGHGDAADLTRMLGEAHRACARLEQQIRADRSAGAVIDYGLPVGLQ